MRCFPALLALVSTAACFAPEAMPLDESSSTTLTDASTSSGSTSDDPGSSSGSSSIDGSSTGSSSESGAAVSSSSEGESSETTGSCEQPVCGTPNPDCDGIAPPPCTSCLQWRETGATRDGIYSIDPDGDGKLAEENVWCDMTTDGGGWTLVQRTVWDPAETAPLFTGFDAFLASTVGDLDPNAGYRLRGSAWPMLTVDEEMLLRLELREATDGSSCAPLFYLGTNAAIDLTDEGMQISEVSSDVEMFVGTEFSATDGGPASTCVVDYEGVPWFYVNCCLTCPTFRGEYWNERHPMVYNYTATIPDLAAQTQSDVCDGEPQPSISSPGVFGANVMEYYLR